ncbi:MAG TPA: DUF3152 domain-containing protein [Acidimicrobiales bacterium]|nr:DUF3152 domain-containing protein [Acidimicrobiales bacterium]
MAALAAGLAGAGLSALGAPASAQQLTYTYAIGSQGAVTSDVGEFADMVRATLADGRGWSLSGAVHFAEVESGPDFRVVLASPAVVDEAGAVCSERYSCRVGDDLLINDDNWAGATPAWPLSLRDYRHMVVNHELGHWLGFGHLDCPGPGARAPVMQQQSIEVEPCRANPWPLPRERRILAERLGVTIGAEPATELIGDHNGPTTARSDGVLRSGPGAVARPGRVDVVVQGTDGYYRTAWTGSAWTAWSGLGSPPPGMAEQSRPAVASWGPGRLDVFVRGADDKLWQRFSTDGGSSWSPWSRPVGDEGVLASAPAVATYGGQQLAVYVVGTDGQVWERYWTGTAWNPAWNPQGGPTTTSIAGHPAAVSSDGSRIDVFVRGGDDRLWQRSWDGQAWSGWSRPVGDQGTLASSPAVTSWAPGTLQVAVRGTDGGVWVLPRNGQWAHWVPMGRPAGGVVGTPAAASRGFGHLDVYTRGTDDLLHQAWT